MFSVIGKISHIPGSTFLAVRRHPFRAAFVFLVVVAAVVVGLWRYAVHQWQVAQTELNDGQYQQARERLNFCLTAWPRSPEVRVLAARAARLTGDLDAAEAHLNRCLKMQGGATDVVQIEFLLIRVQSGEVDDVARPLFDAVEKGHPETAVILETMARAYIIRLRYKPAYACLSRWIELRPNDAKAYQWRGWVLERLNNHKSATTDYHKAMELDPDLIPVRLRVAEMLLEDKQAPEALPHLERLYKQAPDNPHVRGRLGMCRFLQGRTEEARELMESAVIHLPKDPDLLVYLAKIDLQDGKGPEAERRLRKVLETDPSDTETLYNLASALQLQGRSEESAAVLKEYEWKRELVDRTNHLLQNVADSPTAKADDYAEIGRLLLEVGREKLGMYWMDRTFEKDPANQSAHRALVAYYERKGNADKAAVHRKQVRGPAPVDEADSTFHGPPRPKN
jgi:tetratricopeptide (TPR) repeat protein